MDGPKLSSLLKACKSSAQARVLHAKIISHALLSNTHLVNSLINLYASLRLLDSARLVFESIPTNPLHLSPWNSLLAAYSKNHQYSLAIDFFDRLLLFGCVIPDNYTYPSALKACGGLGNAQMGERIHARVVKTGFVSDIVVSSSIVGMYARCGCFTLAIRMFEEMRDKDVACWNNVLSCYYQSGEASKALEMFERMKICGFDPDSVTFTTVLSACARLMDLEMGKRVHEELIRSRVELDGFVSSALVDMYGKCGCLERARKVFEEIPIKSVVSWNSLISGYSLKGDGHSCFELFSRMNDEGVKPTLTTISSLLVACSRTIDVQYGRFLHGYMYRNNVDVDIFTGSSLIDLYLKCGNVRYAEHAFEKMPKANVVSWNVMISGYVGIGSYFKAIDLFHEMRNYGVGADAITFTSVLSACAQLSALEEGRGIHYQIRDCCFESNDIVMSALLDMYAKCGVITDARSVFDKLPVKDIVSWTSIIVAYGSHGQALEALELFLLMQRSKVKPDGVTFLAVLSACSHGGLVDEGCHYFNQMIEDGIKPTLQHYSCLMDLLGRSGRLQEAYSILENMDAIKADSGMLGTLFSACSLHKNLELGERVAKLLIEMDPDDHSTYIVLTNMYASAGKWDEVRKIRSKMKERGLRKNPGCSWIEIDKKIDQFFAEDDSHQQAEMIHECLENLSRQMNKKGSENGIGDSEYDIPDTILC